MMNKWWIEWWMNEIIIWYEWWWMNDKWMNK